MYSSNIQPHIIDWVVSTKLLGKKILLFTVCTLYISYMELLYGKCIYITMFHLFHMCSYAPCWFFLLKSLFLLWIAAYSPQQVVVVNATLSRFHNTLEHVILAGFHNSSGVLSFCHSACEMLTKSVLVMKHDDLDVSMNGIKPLEDDVNAMFIPVREQLKSGPVDKSLGPDESCFLSVWSSIASHLHDHIVKVRMLIHWAIFFWLMCNYEDLI